MEFVHITAETIKLLQVSTIHVACSLSAILEQAQLDALDTSNVSIRVETWRDEPSGILAIHTTRMCRPKDRSYVQPVRTGVIFAPVRTARRRHP